MRWQDIFYKYLKTYSKRLGLPRVPGVIITDHPDDYLACCIHDGSGKDTNPVVLVHKNVRELFRWNRRKAKRVLKFLAAHEPAHALGWKARGRGEWRCNKIAEELTGVSRAEFDRIIVEFGETQEYST